jgi:hypothetical protein
VREGVLVVLGALSEASHEGGLELLPSPACTPSKSSKKRSKPALNGEGNGHAEEESAASVAMGCMCRALVLQKALLALDRANGLARLRTLLRHADTTDG